MSPILKPDYRALGRHVADLRHERRWSLERLAHEAELDRKTIVNIEGGHHIPRLGSVHSLAHAFDVPIGQLVAPLCARHDGAR